MLEASRGRQKVSWSLRITRSGKNELLFYYTTPRRFCIGKRKPAAPRAEVQARPLVGFSLRAGSRAARMRTRCMTMSKMKKAALPCPQTTERCLFVGVLHTGRPSFRPGSAGEFASLVRELFAGVCRDFRYSVGVEPWIFRKVRV